MTQTFKFSVWDGYSNNVFYRELPSYDVASNIINNYPPGYIATAEPVVVTKEQAIITARQWFADNAQACIDEAVSGQLRVNDLTKYVKDQTQRIKDSLDGKWDHTLAFQQRVVYVQTGVCHAILP